MLWGFQDVRQTRCKHAAEKEVYRSGLFTLKDPAEQKARNEQLLVISRTPGTDIAAYSADEPALVWCYDCDEQGDDWWHAWGLLHERAHHVVEKETMEVALKVEVNNETEPAT